MSCSKWLCYYKGDILVETGTGSGSGVQHAINYGFKEIHSIEIDKARYDSCVNRFRNNKSVNLYHGDSISVLPEILSKINVKATFLLDAHVTALDQVHGKIICPIIEELKMIVSHSKKLGVKHIIVIDDVLFFNGSLPAYGHIKLSEIKETIMGIEPTYTIKNGRKYICAI